MKKYFVLYFALALGILITNGCKKSTEKETGVALTQDQKLMQDQFRPFAASIGELDLNSVKNTNKGDKRLHVLTAYIIGSSTKKYILYVDERTNNKTNLQKMVFESNIPTSVENQNQNGTTGFAQFTSLETDESTIKVDFVNGIRTITESSTNDATAGTVTNLPARKVTDLEKVQLINSPLTDCIKKTLRTMSFGTWCLFVAGEPESVACLILACAIDTF